LRQHLARAIIAGRAKSTGRDDYVGLGPAFAKLRGNGVGVVGNRDIARKLHAAPAQLPANPRQVPVSGQSEQQLIAQGEQFVAGRGARI
jgi:hypothetical protein